MKCAYLLLCLAAGLLACGCASGPREPMPPNIPDDTEEYCVEFKVWALGGEIRAEKLQTPQTREPKGEAPRAFRVTVYLNKPAELEVYFNFQRAASLLPAHENEFGRVQMFWQWAEKDRNRNMFSTRSFGNTSETWHEAKFLFRAEGYADEGKERNTIVAFKVLVVFEGDDAWMLKPPSLVLEAQNLKPLEVPLFAGK